MSTPADPSKSSFLRSFTDLRRLPRAFWIVIGAFVVENMAYFGVLVLMTTYLTQDLGWSDASGSIAVSLFTMSVTLFMLGFGAQAERIGLRRGILLALALCVVGRAVFSGAASASVWMATTLVVVALLVTAVGGAILQPLCYSGVKQYTDDRTSSMGYGLIYAIMNLGIVGIGALSSWIRPAVQNVKESAAAGGQAGRGLTGWLAGFSGSGVQAVNWICVGITAACLVEFWLLMTRRAEAAKVRPEQLAPAGEGSRWLRLKAYFTEGPFGNPRFVFFIFMLLPVRTLFAHQWLTMPGYILRAYKKTVEEYDPWLAGLARAIRPVSEGLAGAVEWLAGKPVSDLMEWLVNWINPMIIFIGVPVLTALTRKANVYTLMIVGSLISATPTFLLCFGPDLNLLILYFVVFSVGEAVWSARFLEYASELAPPGKVAQYMGLAQVPWLLAKGTTGFYSGALLSRYCPEETPLEQLQTGTLWFIYGGIAMLSPIGLMLGRRWVMKGMHKA